MATLPKEPLETMDLKVFKFWDLLVLLVLREIRIRYARAALGALWAIFPPLIMVATFSILNFGVLVGADNPFSGVPYPVFAFCGLLPWTHFSTSLTQSTPSLVIAADMIKKASFPREVLPLAKVAAAVFDLLIGVVFLLALFAWYGIAIPPAAIAVPFVFLLQIAFTAGIALVLSVANAYYRDVNYLVQVGIVLAMFATAVVYPIDPDNWIAYVVLGLNPMSSFLNAYREALLLGTWPWEVLLPGACGTVLAVVAGRAVFRRMSRRLAEEL